MWIRQYASVNQGQRIVRCLELSRYFFVAAVGIILLCAMDVRAKTPTAKAMPTASGAASSQVTQAREQAEVLPDAALQELFQGVMFGNPNAPVQIVVYHSLTCAHCNEFKQNVLRVLIETRALDHEFHDVCIIMRDFPNDVLALQAAQVAWSQRDPEVYKRRLLTFADPKKGLYFETDQYIEEFIKYCTETLKIEAQELENCLQDHELRDAIIHQMFTDGQKFQIQFIPFYVINGKPLVQSIDDMKTFREVVQKARKDVTSQPSGKASNPKAPSQKD